MSSQKFRSYFINTLFLSGFFVAIVASFVRYYNLKEFLVHIEVPCDPLVEKCFYRDCENSLDCPPNGLSNYRQFSLSGAVFASCNDIDGCSEVCKQSGGPCTEIVCGETNDDVCAEVKEN